jgi:multiple antibiotic resistance protein
MSGALTETAIYAFVTFFVVLDPLGMGPIFVGLTRGETAAFRRQMAIRGIVIAAIILLVFAFAGDFLLRALGVSIAAFRIAGGVLLFLISFDMLFAHATPIRRTTEREDEEAESKHDISVFPLAIPLIAGPGGLTSVVLLMGRAGSDPMMEAIVLGTMALVLVITLAVLLAADRFTKWLGETGTNVISRVLGIILSALAVQFVIDGVNQAF